MSGALDKRVLMLHIGVVLALFVAQFVVPPYHQTSLARIMVLAIFAMGYNIAFGYAGLLSLGHAMFFAAGVYAAGLGALWLGTEAAFGLAAGLLAGGILAALIGALALRTAGVSFMIVTLMFAQTGYLLVLYFSDWTRGEEGFVLPTAARQLWGLDLSQDGPRYGVALALFALALVIKLALVQAPIGRVWVALRENEERTRMLGYDPMRYKLAALVISGLYAGVAGAAYALLFGYAGASFAAVPYSILPLLYVLMGGAGVVLGPFLGTLLMFYIIDIASGYTTAHLLVTGLALIALMLFAPRGILGSLRARGGIKWLP